MHPLESIERVKEVLRALAERPEPYVKEIPPSPGSRAERYVQLLCPELHDISDVVQPAFSPAPAGSPMANPLATRVTQLEAEVRSLRDLVAKLARRSARRRSRRKPRMARVARPIPAGKPRRRSSRGQ